MNAEMSILLVLDTMKPCAAKGRGRDLADVDRDTKDAAAAAHTLDFAAYRAKLADNNRLPGQQRTCQNFTHMRNPSQVPESRNAENGSG